MSSTPILVNKSIFNHIAQANPDKTIYDKPEKSINFPGFIIIEKISETKEKPANDPVLPNHYSKAGQASPIHLIKQYDLNFPIGNVIKYAARYKDKNGGEDLKKALFYLLWELGLTTEEITEIVEKIK